ncbi:jg13926 [Pararge aegeria aegeria]|uniref:Jg13926 protein n=1 Tax=Pararge aegeria aegeria TaxID=348720 RepID=A0A8S4SHA9_9NEOP|nr:jg13926 [Pararge aegeria aegeria]
MNKYFFFFFLQFELSVSVSGIGDISGCLMQSSDVTGGLPGGPGVIRLRKLSGGDGQEALVIVDVRLKRSTWWSWVGVGWVLVTCERGLSGLSGQCARRGG